MKKAIIAALALVMSGPVCAGTTGVVPNAFANTDGTGTFVGPLASTARRYQMLIHEDQLTFFVGMDLNGITFRLGDTIATPWPGVDTTFGDYEIYLGASVAPADRSFTFADNRVGAQTQVRDGSLTFNANSFPVGDSPNDFGQNITISPYSYTGGHLLVEIVHSGSDGTSRSTDAITTGTAGYGTQFSALWTSNLASATGAQGNFVVTQFTAVPAPSGLLALAGLTLVCRRRRRA